MSSKEHVSQKNSPSRAATAAFVGGALEYYDNYIYALAAALVFGQIFFPTDAGPVGTVAALATFAVSYLARPLGAVLLGHLGDRVGRKQALVVILILMGTCTFVIGCLPTYDAIGIWAPIMLVTLRILQGISVGGETAAATALTIEVSPTGRRGFFTSWAPNGIVTGFILATLVFLPISALPQDQLLAWGWRVPFLLSVIVTIVGFIIRKNLAEPEVFEEAKAEKDLVKLPVVEVFRTHWRSVLRVALCSLAFAMDTVIKVYALALATGAYGIPQGTMLWILLVTHLGALITQPLLGKLSDRIGRKPVFIAGNIAGAVFIFGFLAAIQSQSVPLIFITALLSTTAAFAAINASYPSFFAEMFDLRVRQTGMAVGIQIGLLAAGFAPSVYVALTAGDARNWLPAGICAAVIACIAAISAFSSRETAHIPLEDVGTPRATTEQLVKR